MLYCELYCIGAKPYLYDLWSSVKESVEARAAEMDVINLLLIVHVTILGPTTNFLLFSAIYSALSVTHSPTCSLTRRSDRHRIT